MKIAHDIQKPRSELVSIQLLRALAAILVLLAHLQIKERQYGDATNLVWQNFHFGSIGVDIFFVLSGFIIYYVAGASARSPAVAWQFMKHRFIRVLPLYWALSLVALLVFLVRPEMVNKSSDKPTAILESFLLIPTDYKLLIQNGWTLSYEFLFYGVFCMLLLLTTQSWRAFALIGLAVLSVSLGLIFPSASVMVAFLTDDLLLEFAFGVLIGFMLRRNTHLRHFAWPLAPILWVTTLAACIAVIGGHANWTGLRGIDYGVPAALVVFTALSFERELESLRPLKILGDSSYSLYLSHVLTLPAAGMAWKYFQLNKLVGNEWLLIYLFTSSVSFGIILYFYFENPLTNYLRTRLK